MLLNTVEEYLVIFLALVIIVLINFSIKIDGPPISDVYRTPSTFYWIKVYTFYIILHIRRLITSSDPVEILDKAQKLPLGEKAVDGVYINGSNSAGDCVSMCINRRNNNNVETYVFLKFAYLGHTLTHLRNPETYFVNTKDTREFNVDGLKASPVLPMEKWKISYNGKLKEATTQISHNVQIHLEFSSNSSFFNSECDCDYFLCAKSLALEQWSTAYFNILNEFHLQHYAQIGNLKGTVVIDGMEYSINMEAYRDHSIAKNYSWATYHRYVMHYVTIENGDRFVVGKVSQPIIASNFTLGFMYSAREKKYYPLKDTNFELYQHGEVEDPPTNYAFSFKAGNQQYTMQVNVETTASCYLGREWDCKLLDRCCVVEVNGKKGWGVCQWLYRNLHSKNNLK
ncbi:hypothetical protein FQA39_LY13958 [Lamprigera yunnana]|nr:hypothetical protein FQA39_LY13958 [Lamprigera yunnana]